MMKLLFCISQLLLIASLTFALPSSSEQSKRSKLDEIKQQGRRDGDPPPQDPGPMGPPNYCLECHTRIP